MELMVRSVGSTQLEIVEQAGGYGWYNAQYAAKWMWSGAVGLGAAVFMSNVVHCKPEEVTFPPIF